MSCLVASVLILIAGIVVRSALRTIKFVSNSRILLLVMLLLDRLCLSVIVVATVVVVAVTSLL